MQTIPNISSNWFSKNTLNFLLNKPMFYRFCDIAEQDKVSVAKKKLRAICNRENPRTQTKTPKETKFR
jgi:hypothetical protein